MTERAQIWPTHRDWLDHGSSCWMITYRSGYRIDQRPTESALKGSHS